MVTYMLLMVKAYFSDRLNQNQNKLAIAWLL